MATARNEYEKKGIKIEIMQGQEKGLIEGKNEAKRELAQNMILQGLENTFIAKCLNISTEELQLLLN